MSYLSNISTAAKTTWKGMFLSIQYFFQARKSRKKEWVAEENYFEKANGTFTVQYPHEEIPIPDNGRYQLHNEIDDCIVCDKCAKVCPVNCIDIEPVKATEDLGKTSDGTPKRIHAAKFDIDMAKCCFCGLCTTVCPTECLTMTKVYDFSEFDVQDHNYAFSEMTPLEILEKKKALEIQQQEKELQRTQKVEAGSTDSESSKAKPKFRPRPVSKKKPDAE